MTYLMLKMEERCNFSRILRGETALICNLIRDYKDRRCMRCISQEQSCHYNEQDSNLYFIPHFTDSTTDSGSKENENILFHWEGGASRQTVYNFQDIFSWIIIACHGLFNIAELKFWFDILMKIIFFVSKWSVTVIFSSATNLLIMITLLLEPIPHCSWYS